MSLRQDMDLRDWLKHLESSGRLAVAKPGVDLKFELAGIANRLDSEKATFFPSPSGHDMPVVSGLVSQRAWIAEALGVPENELLNTIKQATANPLPWNVVSAAPCQEVVHDDPDLTTLLPAPVHNELDSGPYISAALAISKSPESGIQNVSLHRLQVSGPKELGALFLPRHTLANIEKTEAEGGDMDIAFVIGNSAAALLASQAVVPIDFDELGIAGALGGKPLDVVKCVGSDLHVPANSEIVIEGKVMVGKFAPEGPFGEFPQYYGERAERHVVRVERVTHRKRPVYHTIVGGGWEHLLLGGIMREATILPMLQGNFPSVTDVHLSRGGTCRYHLYVQIKKRYAGEGKNIAMAALTSHYDIKHVTVVDDDVDVHDPTEVEWAVATRFQADRDLMVLKRAQGSRLDPSADAGVSDKMAFDATVPFGSSEFKFTRIRVPGEEEIDLDARIDTAGKLADHIG